MQVLGLDLEPPVGGRLDARGHAGCVIRWGSGWFEEVRDRVGWNIQRSDKAELLKRVNLLGALFKCSRATGIMQCIENGDPVVMAIEDAS